MSLVDKLLKIAGKDDFQIDKKIGIRYPVHQCRKYGCMMIRERIISLGRRNIAENNCWIGAGVVFLDGSKLEDGCVVAANAVATKMFPVNSVNWWSAS